MAPFSPDNDVEPYGDPTWTPGGTMPSNTSTSASPDVATNMTMADTAEQAVSSAIGQRAGEAGQVHMGL